MQAIGARFIPGHWTKGQRSTLKLEAGTGLSGSGKTGLSSYRKEHGKPVK
jgi:hypothetical protein